jgi:hypothetical protein
MGQQDLLAFDLHSACYHGRVQCHSKYWGSHAALGAGCGMQHVAPHIIAAYCTPQHTCGAAVLVQHLWAHHRRIRIPFQVPALSTFWLVVEEAEGPVVCTSLRSTAEQ